ncbi:hypothetical protein HYALB_00006117 [Hymenoscyphus albidus]|uniref:Uncharacterized protein n=1 Tax=Hymenoscyphus albidus TaxID=595503 RepID=A0A9N9LNL4_9HELO|nr:hypothetical protein HYALB_00006117 [Hymenoscyphus albidus]
MESIRQQSNINRPAPRASDLCVGAIVWLAPKEISGEDIKCCCEPHISTPAELDHDGYNHPVVVLKISQRPGSRGHGDLVCVVACITSFDSCSLKRYMRKLNHRPHLKNSIPIFHSTSEPPEGHFTQLHLESGDLHKQSYVGTSHIYPVRRTSLQSFGRRGNVRAYKTRLTEGDYRLLMAQFELGAEEYESTDMVPQTAARRLRLLANPLAQPEETFHIAIFPPLPRIEPARREPPPAISPAERAISWERYIEQRGYGTVTAPARQVQPPPAAPVYPNPVTNNHTTYCRSQDYSEYQDHVRNYRQYPYQQQEQRHGRSDESSGDDDWSGIAAFVVIGLIIWWKW